ncbi:hypothetical protein KHQ88_05000 [Mycoplasmatota bacterium]|nr:hypothetical protein KHQ88_05000 [Mycoplasmatota bacterium]
MENAKELSLKQVRKQRMFIVSFLLFALVLTIAFGTLEDPFRYTLSNIGNRFGWGPRIMFIIWAFVSGLAIEISFIFIMKLINYNDRKCSLFIGLSSISIILTGLIPALKNELPFWHTLHVISSGLIALFFFLAMIPLIKYIVTIIPDFKIFMYIWLAVILLGSIVLLILFRITAMFEIWFFVTTILFLIYLTFILYEKAIIESYVKENETKQ